MELIARNDAKQAGKTRYFTGLPCKHGHVAERFVSSKGCVECAKKITSAWVQRNIEKRSAYNREWQKQNPEKVVAYSAAQRAKRPRGEAVERVRKWRLENPGRMRFQSLFYQNKRRAAEINRTPSWADFKKIEQIYQEASEFREAGLKVDVDHVIPLQGKLVSGLHVHQNLRICLSSFNRTKSNSYQI